LHDSIAMIPSKRANHHYESKRCGLISTGRTLGSSIYPAQIFMKYSTD
jgi:hypothetical protein